MAYYGSTPDYDRYLAHMEEARSCENDAFAEFCEERELDADSDAAVDAWEEFKRADMESQLRDEDMLAERMAMELRDGE